MHNRIKTDHLKYLLIILMGFLISLAYTSPLVIGLSNDKEVFRYIAMLISKGLVPYRDALEMRAPLIFFLGAPFSGTEWSFWLLFSTVTAISGIAFYKIALSLNTKHPYLCTAIYFALLGWPGLANGGMRAYDLTAALATLITLLYLFRKNHSLVLLGILLALVFFTQQNDIIHLLPVTFYAIFSRADNYWNIKKIIINCFQVVSGFIGIAAIVFEYFWYHGAVNVWLDNTFFFIFSNYLIPVPTLHLRLLDTYYLLTDTKILLLLSLIVLHNLCFVLRSSVANSQRTMVFIITAAMFLTIISANISGHYYPQHILSYGVYLAIQIAFFTSYVGSQAIYKALGYLLALGIFFSAIFFVWQEQVNPISEQYDKTIASRSSQERWALIYSHATQGVLKPYEQMLADVKGQEGQLYILGNVRLGLLALNTDLKIISPSKWYGNLYLFKESVLAQVQTLIFEQIEKYQTKYIIDFVDDDTFRSAARKKIWQQMLADKYSKKMPINWDNKNGWIYVRNSRGGIRNFKFSFTSSKHIP